MSKTEKLVGELLDGRYEVVRVVGKGGMGTVYEGRNVNIGKRVAIKVLLPELIKSEEYVTRFQREARAAAEIGHAHIVEVFDFGHTPEELPYIIMEFLEGQGLDGVLEQEGTLSPGRAVDIAGQVLHALQAAHEAGIIHRDLKPENIFLCSRPDLYWQGEPGSHKRDFVKVLDFGISLFRRMNLEEAKITQTGVIFGTPYYMSPEQARASKDIDYRSDIYSVGALLYTMLTGMRPFDGESAVEILSSVIEGDCKKLDRVVPGLPADLVKAVERAMAVNRYKRFESAIDFMNALMPFTSRDSLVPRLRSVSERVTAVDGEGKTEKVSTLPQYQRATLDEDPEITAPDAPLDDEAEGYAPVEPRPTRQDGPTVTGRTETPKTMTLTSEQPALRSRLPLIASLSVLVLGAATIIILASLNSSKRRAAPEQPARTAAAPEQVASTPEDLRPSTQESLNINLEIAGSPSGASIYLDGHYFGKLPQTTTIRADGREHSVRVAMEGYVTQVQTVTLHMQKAHERVEFLLEPEGPPTVEEEEEEEQQPLKTKPKKPIRIKIPSADDIYGKPKKKVKIPSAEEIYK